MGDQNTPSIGSNWVLSPNLKIADIESEFDESASGYEASSRTWNYRGAEDGAAFFIQHIDPSAKVIDVGCGSGLVGNELSAAGFNSLTGCDISELMLEQARAKGVYTGGLFKADIRKMPFSDNTFDALICIAVLTYSDDLELTFRELERVIRPGGTLLFSHRIDLEAKYGFAEAVKRRLDSGDWIVRAISEPQLYYPEKSDYGHEIKIRYHAYDLGQ